MKQKFFGIVSTLTIFATTFSYAMFQGGFVSWFLFYTVLPFLTYQLLVLFLPLQKLKVEREVSRDKCKTGETIKVTVKVKQPFPFPILYLIVKDELNGKLIKRVNKSTGSNNRMLFPLFKKHLTFTYEIQNLLRGEHKFEHITIMFGDLFGFIERSHVFNIETTIAVYPNDRGIEYPFRREQVQKGSIHSRRKNQHNVTSVVGVREYVPGDRLSWLDWKATARTAELKTKEFEQNLKQEVIICLDRTKLMDLDKENHLFEKVVSCAASLSRSVLQQGTGLAFFSFGNENTELPVYYGIEQKRRIDNHLLNVKADSERSFHLIIKEAEKKWPAGLTIVVVTSHLTDKLVNQLSMLRSKNLKVDVYFVKLTKSLTQSESMNVRKLTELQVRLEIVNGQKQGSASEGGEIIGSA